MAHRTSESRSGFPTFGVLGMQVARPGTIRSLFGRSSRFKPGVRSSYELTEDNGMFIRVGFEDGQRDARDLGPQLNAVNVCSGGCRQGLESRTAKDCEVASPLQHDQSSSNGHPMWKYYSRVFSSAWYQKASLSRSLQVRTFAPTGKHGTTPPSSSSTKTLFIVVVVLRIKPHMMSRSQDRVVLPCFGQGNTLRIRARGGLLARGDRTKAISSDDLLRTDYIEFQSAASNGHSMPALVLMNQTDKSWDSAKLCTYNIETGTVPATCPIAGLSRAAFVLSFSPLYVLAY
ncbi:hypothetical protein C8R47DRAFT_1066116 [Mycena vitilis]|nr:hypothetical protein C8R47DRAFT_1066116 [Mycena vitilis]